jgi:hypothetical protein
MPESDDILNNAGDHFGFVADFAFGDAEQRRLRYHLLRLGALGLESDDVEGLGELGRLVFQGSDVKDQVAKIKQRPGASRLAIAIADIVERSGSVRGPVSGRAVMLGAVLGAYAALSHVPGLDEKLAAALGATGGAVAMSVSEFIVDNISRESWAEYLRMDT